MIWNLRLDAATKARWQEGAEERGYSLSEFVRACVEGALAPAGGSTTPAEKLRPSIPPAPPAPRVPSMPPAPARKRRVRAEMCAHRIPPTAHCGTCDA